MQRQDLEGLSRDELVARAERLGVARPRVLTQPELMDEILGRTATNERERAKARGWLGRARDLIAGVVERGLHLPEVAQLLRATPAQGSWPAPPPPLATVTLAEIYAAQGHLDRAVAVLDDVLAREPEHEEARTLRERFQEQAVRRKRSVPPAASRSASEPPPTERADAQASPAAAAFEPESGSTSEPLPEKYDVDEVVAIAVDATTVYVYWELRAVTFAHAQARRPNGRLVLRSATVTPSWDGPVHRTRDDAIDALFGDLFARGLPPGSNVRVSVGWLTGVEFEPLAVGIEVAAPRTTPVASLAHIVERWSPDAPVGLARSASSAVVGTAIERFVRAAVLGATGGAGARGEVGVPGTARGVGGNDPGVIAGGGGTGIAALGGPAWGRRPSGADAQARASSCARPEGSGLEARAAARASSPAAVRASNPAAARASSRVSASSAERFFRFRATGAGGASMQSLMIRRPAIAAASAFAFLLSTTPTYAAPEIDDDEPAYGPSVDLRDQAPHELWGDAVDRGSLWFALEAGAMLRSSGERSVTGLFLLNIPFDRVGYDRSARAARAGSSGMAEDAAPRLKPGARSVKAPPAEPPAAPPEPPPAATDGDAPPPLPVVVTPAVARRAVRAALRAARLEAPDGRLDALASRARSSALLPELRLRATRLVDEAERLSPTSYDPDRTTASGATSLWLEARVTWRLDRLVFADEEVGIERMRYDRADAQAKVVSRVLELLFAWQRAVAAEGNPRATPDEQRQALFKVLEAEATLDVLTDGWFSRWRAPP